MESQFMQTCDGAATPFGAVIHEAINAASTAEMHASAIRQHKTRVARQCITATRAAMRIRRSAAPAMPFEDGLAKRQLLGLDPRIAAVVLPVGGTLVEEIPPERRLYSGDCRPSNGS